MCDKLRRLSLVAFFIHLSFMASLLCAYVAFLAGLEQALNQRVGYYIVVDWVYCSCWVTTLLLSPYYVVYWVCCSCWVTTLLSHVVDWGNCWVTTLLLSPLLCCRLGVLQLLVCCTISSLLHLPGSSWKHCCWFSFKPSPSIVACLL